MKKILGLAAGLLLTAMTYAQGVTFNDAGADYDKAATTSFHFTFDSNYASEDLISAGSYYESYFTTEVVANENGSTVTFTLVEDNEMARRVISRYFISMEIQTISANGEDMTIDEFMAAYIMLD